MRRATIATMILVAFCAAAGAESFDAATFVPPEGMALVAQDAEHIVYQSGSAEGPDLSRIELHRIQSPKGSMAADFEARWQALAAPGRLSAFAEPETVRNMTFRNGHAVGADGRVRYVALVTIQSGNCVMVATQNVFPTALADERARDFIDFILGLEVTEQPACSAP